MQEIMVPELLIGFFITISLLRPFIKKLWRLEGLIWFPILALGMIIALFPAYGFRPECIPLLVYGCFCVLFYLPSLISFLNHSRDNDFWGQNPVPRIILLLLLVPALGTALFFAPAPDSALLEAGVTSAILIDEARKEELMLRIYSAYDAGEPQSGMDVRGNKSILRPLLVIIPPVSGSIMVIDRVCGELRDAGFTAVTYSRRGFDSPAVGPTGKVYRLSLNRWFQLFRVQTRGKVTVAANIMGRSLEEGRRQDIVFLLEQLRQNRLLPVSADHGAAITAALEETDLSAVFLAGYDVGGSALLDLTGSPDFSIRYPAVRGVIIVESPLFSVLTGEELPSTPPPNDNWFIAVWSGIRSRAMALRTRKITGIGEVPRPNVPVGFILSDNVVTPRYREDRYAASLKVLRNAAAPAILMAAAGAGPLDYSDVPEKYPLYSVLHPGTRRTLRIVSPTQKIHGPRETAGLMTNFAAAILEETRQAGPILSRKILPSQDFHVETNNSWNSLKNRSIL